MLRPVSLKLFIPIAVLIFALALAACGDDEDGDGGTSESGSSDDTEEVTGTDSGDEEDESATEDDAASSDEDEDDAATEEEDASEEDGDDGSTEGAAVGSADWDQPITFADNDWDSALALNRIAQTILEEGYGYETDATFGQTIPLFQGMLSDDIQVNMEIWVAQMEGWDEAVEEGTLYDLGTSFGESEQGWYVPTYMIEGDEERGIEPITPDLESVEDLPEYWEVFQDPEDPDKGRFMDCIAGWECERVNEAKFYAYGLDETYNRFLPGSGAALDTSLVTAYDQGEPWLGYYWGPSWIFGQVDMTMLEEPEYTDECWEGIQDAIANDEIPDEACAYPAVPVHIAVTDDFYEAAPDVVEFLENFEMTMDDVNEILAHMQETDGDPEDGAEWFLRERTDLWHEWVPEQVVEDVEAALE